MRPLRYSINVTLDGCCDHRAISADEDVHRHAVENLDRADALLFGRVTYEMMEAAFRPTARKAARPDWMEPFARTIDAAKKYVVSSTLDRVDWNAELVHGDLGNAVQQLKRKSGQGPLARLRRVRGRGVGGSVDGAQIPAARPLRARGTEPLLPPGEVGHRLPHHAPTACLGDLRPPVDPCPHGPLVGGVDLESRGR